VGAVLKGEIMEGMEKKDFEGKIDIEEFEQLAGHITEAAKGPGKLLEMKKWLILSGINFSIAAVIIIAAIEKL
jgi:hypothetical protein